MDRGRPEHTYGNLDPAMIAVMPHLGAVRATRSCSRAARRCQRGSRPARHSCATEPDRAVGYLILVAEFVKKSYATPPQRPLGIRPAVGQEKVFKIHRLRPARILRSDQRTARQKASWHDYRGPRDRRDACSSNRSRTRMCDSSLFVRSDSSAHARTPRSLARRGRDRGRPAADASSASGNSCPRERRTPRIKLHIRNLSGWSGE